MMHDFHTHNLLAPPGTAIVNLPEEWTLRPDLFRPQPGALYSAAFTPGGRSMRSGRAAW